MKATCALVQMNFYVVFPFYEKVRDGELYNTAAFLDRRGEIVGL